MRTRRDKDVEAIDAYGWALVEEKERRHQRDGREKKP
jgi:hypothetical protein